MNDAQFDQLIARASDPNLIPGIYNYCDRRCSRCRFAMRCFDYVESLRRPAPAPGANPEDSIRQSMEDTLDMLRIIAERRGIPAPAMEAEDSAEESTSQKSLSRAVADPDVALSKRYVMTAWPITRALWPIVMPRQDAKVIDALETIEAICSLVSSKTLRAVHGALEADFDPEDLQGDANGSAKIARLLVDDSRRAWRVMMEAGRATANGVPAKLVQMLDELDAALASRFPRAMEFVRPGFDAEPDPSAWTSEHDAVLTTFMPRSRA